MTSLPVISLLTFTPLLGAAASALAARQSETAARRVALGTAALTLVQVLFLFAGFDARAPQLQFVERCPWIPSLRVEYFVGLDGLGLVMVLLSALLVPFSLLAAPPEKGRGRYYYPLVLLLQSGLLGSFTALNFVHWFIFWELSLIPAYFLVKLWGGPGCRAAANQFFLYTFLGSVGLLLAFQALYLATGTFDFQALADLARQGVLPQKLSDALGWPGLSVSQLSLAIFLLALLGFAVKVPLVPFHSWLPATYAEAPTGVSILLTGAMSKMGVYGLLRLILPIFPEQFRSVQEPLLLLAVATILCSAWAALAQSDLKRTLAYSSINHLGYCLLGIFAASQAGTDPAAVAARSAALNGVVVQMFNHGPTAALSGSSMSGTSGVCSTSCGA
jgi:NADH-quinone oxidoreductase subunit M